MARRGCPGMDAIPHGRDQTESAMSGFTGAEAAFVISRNIHRRRLTREQNREMISALLKENAEDVGAEDTSE